MVWENPRQDSGNAGVFGRRIAANGTPLGAEIDLSDFTNGNQSAPDEAIDASGEVAFVWQHPDADGSGIFGNCLRDDNCLVPTVFVGGFESGDACSLEC